MFEEVQHKPKTCDNECHEANETAYRTQNTCEDTRETFNHTVAYASHRVREFRVSKQILIRVQSRTSIITIKSLFPLFFII